MNIEQKVREIAREALPESGYEPTTEYDHRMAVAEALLSSPDIVIMEREKVDKMMKVVRKRLIYFHSMDCDYLHLWA